MNKSIFSIIIFVTLISGCTKDSTPKYENVEKIIIDGEKITSSEYADRYCRGKQKNTDDDHFRCEEAINHAVSESRRTDRPGSIFYGRPPPQRYETPNDRYKKKLSEEKEIKEKSQQVQ